LPKKNGYDAGMLVLPVMFRIYNCLWVGLSCFKKIFVVKKMPQILAHAGTPDELF